MAESTRQAPCYSSGGVLFSARSPSRSSDRSCVRRMWRTLGSAPSDRRQHLGLARDLSPFGAGIVVTATAFVILALVARGRDEDLLAPLAADSYVVGVVAMVVSMAFHAGPEILAARAIAQKGEVPPWYEPLERLASALYTVYMTLAFSALILVAASLWKTNSLLSPLALAAGVFGLVMGSFVRYEVALVCRLQPGGPAAMGSCVGDLRRGGSRIRGLNVVGA